MITPFYAMSAFLRVVMKDINTFNFKLLEDAAIVVMIRLGMKRGFARIMGITPPKDRCKLN